MEKYLKYIQEQMSILAQVKHPDNKTLQLIFQVGFLQAQLAQAMHDDNHNYYRFRDCIHLNGCVVPTSSLSQKQPPQQRR